MKGLALAVIIIAIAVFGIRGCGCACGADPAKPSTRPAAQNSVPSIIGYWEEIENGKAITIAVYNEDRTFRIEALDPKNPSRKLRASGEYSLNGKEMVRTFKAFSFQGVTERQRANMAANANRNKDLPQKATVEWVDPKEFRFTESTGRTSIWRRKPGT